MMMMMMIMTLDVRATHVNNSDCPMRISLTPDGRNWMCVDCGLQILWKSIEVEEKKDDDPR